MPGSGPRATRPNISALLSKSAVAWWAAGRALSLKQAISEALTEVSIPDLP